MADDDSFVAFIRRIRSGDEAAAAELVRQFEPVIRLEVRRRLSDPRLYRLFDSMDICQSVLASLVQPLQGRKSVTVSGCLRVLPEVVIANRSDYAKARGLLAQAVARTQTALRLTPGTKDFLDALREQYADLTETLVRLKDHAEAARTAQQLPPIYPQKWEGYLSAGWFLARCAALAEKDEQLSSDKQKELAKDYADQAVQRLREAVRKGYRDLNYLKTNEDLQGLRRRDDFQKLLKDLAEKSTKGAPEA